MQIKFSEEDSYKPSFELLAAINSSLFLRRPLLITGEPGTGKTECANFIARQIGKNLNFETPINVFRFNAKSASQFTDLFYYYDAVEHFGDKSNRPKESFISFEKLGLAILGTHNPNSSWEKFENYKSEVLNKKPPFGSVVLIDEIDKAPRDFPNDLLAELEKEPLNFRIKEFPGFEIFQNSRYPIFIVITSNSEKSLPDAFLRRCVFHYIKFPDDKLLLQIVKANLNIDDSNLEAAVNLFLYLRENAISKPPATSELLDWILFLKDRGLINENLGNHQASNAAYKIKLKETVGILAKSKADFDILTKIIGE